MGTSICVRLSTSLANGAFLSQVGSHTWWPNSVRESPRARNIGRPDEILCAEPREGGGGGKALGASLAPSPFPSGTSSPPDSKKARSASASQPKAAFGGTRSSQKYSSCSADTRRDWSSESWEMSSAVLIVHTRTRPASQPWPQISRECGPIFTSRGGPSLSPRARDVAQRER
eukprot:scaffold248673_cov37-Tisochrysis_lutea.AAC.1